jgi:hypothetical protein
VGQFRSAGGLVLLSGRSWGLRFPAARKCAQADVRRVRVESGNGWGVTMRWISTFDRYLILAASTWAMMSIGFVAIGFCLSSAGKNAAHIPRLYHCTPRLIFLMRRAVSMVSLVRAPCR